MIAPRNKKLLTHTWEEERIEELELEHNVKSFKIYGVFFLVALLTISIILFIARN